MTQEEWEESNAVAAAMVAHGGSFVRALGYLVDMADEQNLLRLKGAFPELWAKYGAMARKEVSDGAKG